LNTLGIRPPGTGTGGGDIYIGAILSANVVDASSADVLTALSANLNVVDLAASVSDDLSASIQADTLTAELCE